MMPTPDGMDCQVGFDRRNSTCVCVGNKLESEAIPRTSFSHEIRMNCIGECVQFIDTVLVTLNSVERTK